MNSLALRSAATSFISGLFLFLFSLPFCGTASDFCTIWTDSSAVLTLLSFVALFIVAGLPETRGKLVVFIVLLLIVIGIFGATVYPSIRSESPRQLEVSPSEGYLIYGNVCFVSPTLGKECSSISKNLYTPAASDSNLTIYFDYLKGGVNQTMSATLQRCEQNYQTSTYQTCINLQLTQSSSNYTTIKFVLENVMYYSVFQSKPSYWCTVAFYDWIPNVSNSTTFDFGLN